MDYVVGSVAALISGNVTPNRPRVLKRALTPMKHQPSPNVTPKSESVTDRSIFLSPTMQKKKAIVKKSPKRIFQNPELDVTSENDGYSSTSSPKADKVKKHLKDELDSDIDKSRFILSPKSPKNKMSTLVLSPSTKLSKLPVDCPIPEEIQASNESTPKKKKKKLSLVSELGNIEKSNKNNCNTNQDNYSLAVESPAEKSTCKKKKKSKMFTVEPIDSSENQTTEAVHELSLDTENRRNRKLKKKFKNTIKDIGVDSKLEIDKCTSVNKENISHSKDKKNKKLRKNSPKNVLTNLIKLKDTNDSMETETHINPNAVTNQDTESEHESDDDIQSENEENNKAVLDVGSQESSDDDDEETDKKSKKNNEDNVKERVDSEEEVKRTLFVGNVPFSNKCKKEVKRIFSKYGRIETVRIRTVPVKDGRVTPKLALIKNELHPDRSTVNVYIKYAHPSSVNDALAENNTVINDHHLRVARSDVTGSEHDPKYSVFVGNIPFALEDEALRAKFVKCGEIESVRIVRDRKTNAGKGFGYVNFASKDGVELALSLPEEDLTLKNRILRVKRCTQSTANQQRRRQTNQGRPQTNQGRPQTNQGRPQTNQGRPQTNQGRPQTNQGRPQTNQGRQQNYQGRQQNQGKYFNFRKGTNDNETQINRLGKNQFGNDRFQRRDQSTDGKGEGAYRRIMMKRKPQESSDGPPQKIQKNLNQPNKEKKPRKEFVGMTADKKKIQKRKLTKDQKKKRALSEILTKQRH